jgi:ABC-2 type transport system permease protein
MPPGRSTGRCWGYGPVPRLLAARLRMARNAALERRGWTLVLGALVAAWALGSHHLAGLLLTEGVPPPGRLERPLAAGLATLCGGVAVTGVSFAISGLYLARDLELLLSAPIAPRAVLLTKLCVQLSTGLGLAALLAGPWLAAYLAGRGALGSLAVLGLVSLALAALALCAATAVTIATVRVVPARRIRDAAALLVTGTVFAVTAVNVVLRTPGAVGSAMPLALDAPGRGRLADSPWLPTGWAARAVTAAVRGEHATPGLLTLGLLAAAAAAVAALTRVAEPAFLAGYQRASEAGEGRARRRRRGRLVAGRPGGPRAAWMAIALKDLRELRRDASQLGQLILPVALFALYVVAPGQSPTVGAGPGRLPGWFGVALSAGFASLFAASGVALRGVGAEGRRLWILRCAPVSPAQVLGAKFAVGLGIAAGLGMALLLAGGLRQQTPPADLALVAVRLLVVISGLVGLATGLGALRPRLDWTDPRRSVGIGQSLGFLSVGSLYLTVCFALMALPYAGHGGAGGPTAGDAALVVVAVASALPALRGGVARLRTLDL